MSVVVFASGSGRRPCFRSRDVATIFKKCNPFDSVPLKPASRLEVRQTALPLGSNGCKVPEAMGSFCKCWCWEQSSHPCLSEMMLKVRRLSGYTWAAKRLRWQARGLRCILRAWFSWPSLHYAICSWFHPFSLHLHRANKHHAFVSIDMCRVHRQQGRKARYEGCSALIAEIRTGCRAERNASRTESVNDDYHSTTTTTTTDVDS